ncbi:PAS domain S-box-containing protein/diguanylate cyclase (GGDEF) domain-containing protein [Geodermatophilus amargosae]|uniref:PAS domain S-box-containing protein/diguanylate cyclase (GGDEF) domain-containing protein n=1 Tax=Geodermatophilus amargosae TaxID=1296565 RepID=A0A1I7A9E0_9ACTN|nr:diguanylate cyclase [Geodermatophilus amargosae]SFT71543.1 PAS domain S-box-containing protein/diguanylate cyclase (GGDEF) domain-containing protein [Geodermatophilus amargosae]
MQPGSDPVLDRALRGVRSAFQPIVEIDTGRVVAYEALARGPVGPLERPDALFAAARAAGRLAELDEACRAAAFRGAADAGLVSPLTVFVNVEPEVLDTAPLADLVAIAEGAPGDLRVVMEITERAIAARPAELLRTVERVRELGWAIAVDDVGAESMSLAFLPLLCPDVVKLDLRLVQDRPGPAIAEIMNAVNAYAERSGAVVLAEGIETEEHLVCARGLGATLGQGWLFGRPGPGADERLPVGELLLPGAGRPSGALGAVSPFACLPDGVPLRRAPKALLIELSKQLEREAMRLGETCVVAATFQEARHFTVSTTQRYRDLVERTGFVCALGEDLPVEPLPGLRGAHLDPDDPVRGEWDVAVLSPHFSAALLARDLGDEGPDLERTFEYALTYDRATVSRAAQSLLSRVAPRTADATPADSPAPRPPVPAGRPAAGLAVGTTTAEVLLRRALEATPSGVTVVDMRLPDQPIVYANEAFRQLAGLPSEEILGRNCRLLQSPDTDPGAVARIRAAVEAGQACRETVLNLRGPDRTPWFNELHLAPVHDSDGTVVQYIGVQVDVTARVEAERALVRERDRTSAALARIQELAYTDPLTGLLNRRRLEEQVEAAIWEARARGDALGLLFVDLDGFKAVNDRFGHAAGDELLQVVAGRLQQRVRRRDLLARLGGDEFLVALPDLRPETALAEATRVADELTASIRRAVPLFGTEVHVGASIGVSVCPEDGVVFADLLHRADLRMYDRKAATRGVAVRAATARAAAGSAPVPGREPVLP